MHCSYDRWFVCREEDKNIVLTTQEGCTNVQLVEMRCMRDH